MKSLWTRFVYICLFVYFYHCCCCLSNTYYYLIILIHPALRLHRSWQSSKVQLPWWHEGWCWYGAMIPHPMPMTAGCHSTQQRIAMQCNYLKSVECGDSAGWPQNAPWTTQTSGLEFVFTVISRIIFKLWTWFNLHNISTESRWIYYLFAPPFWRGAANIDTNNRSLNREKDQDNEITFLKLVWISQSQC